MTLAATPPLLAPLVLLLSGCFPRLEIDVPARDTATTDDTGTATDDADSGDGGEPALRIDAVDPVEGPTGGGTEVVIEGGPFDASAEVWFGDERASLQSWASDQLRVKTPSTTDTGLVDIRIELDDGTEATAPDAWTWWLDADDGAFLLGSWTVLDVANETTWEDEPAPLFDAWVRLVRAGTDVEPWERYGIDRGDCGQPYTTIPGNQGPDEVFFGYDGEELSLGWSETERQYVWAGKAAPGVRNNAHLNVRVGDSDINPQLYLPELGQLPASSPSMTTPDFSAPFVPELDHDLATLRWVTGGHPLLLVLVGQGEDLALICPVSDTGTFTLPSRDLEDLDWTIDASKAYADAWVAVAAVRQDERELTWNHGTAMVDAATGPVGRVRFLADPGEVSP